MVFGNATVFVPPDDNPDHGGGPIRRSPLVTVRNDEMVQWVLRTPHPPVREHEPGGAVSRYVRDKKFLPDGRLVPRTALGGALGSTIQIMDAGTALTKLSAQYVALRKMQGHIVDTYTKVGTHIPCEVMGGFNAAVREYRKNGSVVLDAIRKALPKAQLFQTPVDMSGKPLLDSSGQPKRNTIDVPLHPGSFVVTNCPSGTALAGTLAFGDVGSLGDWKNAAATAGLVAAGVGLFIVAAPLAAAVGAATAAGIAVSAGTTAAGAGLALLGVLRAIKIVWPDASEQYVTEFTAWSENRLKCLDAAAARGVKGEAAVQECGAAAGAPKPPSVGLGFWGWLGVGTAVVGAAAATIYVIKRRKRFGVVTVPTPQPAVAGWRR